MCNFAHCFYIHIASIKRVTEKSSWGQNLRFSSHDVDIQNILTNLFFRIILDKCVHINNNITKIGILDLEKSYEHLISTHTEES